MSDYKRLLELAEKLKCQICQGSGEIAGADFGYTNLHTWPCKHCKGTGWITGFKFELKKVDK